MRFCWNRCTRQWRVGNDIAPEPLSMWPWRHWTFGNPRRNRDEGNLISRSTPTRPHNTNFNVAPKHTTTQRNRIAGGATHRRTQCASWISSPLVHLCRFRHVRHQYGLQACNPAECGRYERQWYIDNSVLSSEIWFSFTVMLYMSDVWV